MTCVIYGRMSERNIFVGVVLALIIGIGIFGFADKVKDFVTTTPSPSPSSQELFNESTRQQQIFLEGITLDSYKPEVTGLLYSENKKLTKFPGILKPEYLQSKKVVIQTAKGLIQMEIYPEASMAASNFLILASNGFYDGLIFHRVEKGFVIQGGDPNGTGTGGPGYKFPDEPVTRQYTKGIVAYANSGPNTNGSQFFIMLEDKLDLPKNYTIFGKVISGMDVAGKIVPGDLMQQVVVQNLN